MSLKWHTTERHGGRNHDYPAFVSPAVLASVIGLVGTWYYAVYLRKHPALRLAAPSKEKESNKKARPWRMIPGRQPLLGHLPEMGSVEYFNSKCEEWANLYGQETGCFEIDMAGIHYLIVCRADRAQELFRLRPIKVRRTRQMVESSLSIGHCGVFSAEGDVWKREHRIVSAALNQANLSDYLSVIKTMVDRLLAKWRAQLDHPIVVDEDLLHLAADAIAKVSMDRDYDFLREPGSQVAKDVTSLTDAFLQRGMSPVWYWRIPVFGQYIDGRGGAIRRVLKRINVVVDEEEQRSTDGERKTFLQKFLCIMQSDKAPIPRERVVGNVLGLFLAGTHTSSKALKTALYLLSQDTQLQEQLRQEADRVDFEKASLRDLYTLTPRVKSFFHEVHRVYGVPVNGLETSKEVPFCGSTLPKDTCIMVLSHYIAMSDSEDSDVPRGPRNAPPSKFCAERWLDRDEIGALRCPSPSNKSLGFGGFGSGVRSCPGRSYAESFSYIMMGKLLQQFEWTLPADHEPIEFIFEVTLSPRCPIRLNMKARTSLHRQMGILQNGESRGA